jgi:hypothetical protein
VEDEDGAAEDACGGGRPSATAARLRVGIAERGNIGDEEEEEAEDDDAEVAVSETMRLALESARDGVRRLLRAVSRCCFRATRN